ncbi:DUF4272 domain-containing protein [Bacillus carboniphilus]|uniref:DUF4272 domain-containing protein n=1 Tax=Bacillus carboniphilus TaxID=86663 RepID=A0ABY9JR00_9BACI|nr:DUF4272 domain-containing protein [Bacillus carboniphilus]WLR41830.1 DUF4272 domain-containing protein [Bacillus carboniphilus]
MKSVEFRKHQSERKLSEMNIPINHHLPFTEDTKQVTVRKKEDIINRIIPLTIVSAKSMGAPNEKLAEFIEQFKASELFTEDEHNFLKSKNPNQNDIMNFSWKIECVWVLLWSIHLISNVEDLSTTCDVDLVYEMVLTSSIQELLSKADLRPTSEIMDAVDYVYRAHWAVREAQINGKTIPSNLDPGVVYERHYALNWIVNYMEQEWDEVSTDT